MDKIVYTVVTQPGGVDGLDTSDKGGKAIYATFDKKDAENVKGNDTRYKIKADIVDHDERTQSALAKLDEIDKLVLNLTKSKTCR